jgi:hypothetical protein
MGPGMTDSENAWTEAAKAGRLVARQLSFDDWLAIARGLHAMRERLRDETGVSHDASPIFAKAMAEFVREHKWAARFMGDGKSSFRSAAYALVDNEAAISEWRSTLSAGDKLRWRHPEVVMREWRRATMGAAEAKAKPSLKDQVAALKKENAALKREVRSLKVEHGRRRS